MTGCCSFPWAAASPRDGWADVSGAVSVLLTWLVIGVLVYLLASVLLPELYKSVINLMGNVETYYNTINGWVRQLLDSNPELETLVSDRLKGYYTDITTWLDTLLPQATALMSAVSGGVVSALNFLLDLLVGVIVSIFLLATKEQCAAYARKVIFGLFPRALCPGSCGASTRWTASSPALSGASCWTPSSSGSSALSAAASSNSPTRRWSL